MTLYGIKDGMSISYYLNITVKKIIIIIITVSLEIYLKIMRDSRLEILTRNIKGHKCTQSGKVR